MKIPRLILALTVVALAGCGKVKEEEKSKNPLSPNTEQRVINTKALCNGELTDRGSIVRNPWMDMRMTSKNILITDTFVFKGDTLTKRTVCSYDKKSVEVIATGQIGLSEKVNEFVIIKGAKVSAQITVGGRDYPCTAEILQSEDPIKFQFEGDCLHLIPNAETALSYPPGFW